MRDTTQLILVIDDDPNIIQALHSLLSSKGYRVEGVQDGHQGIEYIKHHDVDLVITDIHMPNRDGIEVILHVRKTMPSVKIICMSGGMTMADFNFLNEARMLGAHRVLDKPIDPLLLLRYVQELLADGDEDGR